MKLTDVITPQEIEAIFRENDAAVGEIASNAWTDFVGEHVPREEEYIEVLMKGCASPDMAVGMYRMLAYIAYNLRQKELRR